MALLLLFEERNLKTSFSNLSVENSVAYWVFCHLLRDMKCGMKEFRFVEMSDFPPLRLICLAGFRGNHSLKILQLINFCIMYRRAEVGCIVFLFLLLSRSELFFSSNSRVVMVCI